MGEGATPIVTRAEPHRVPGRAPLQRDGQAVAAEDPGGAREDGVVAALAALPTLPLADALARLRFSDASEAWSALTGAAFLAVDVRAAAPVHADDVPARLAAVPCPTLALADPAGDPVHAALLAAFDVVVTEEAALGAVADGITRAPLAAATLVQVLRATAGLTATDALAVESMAYGALQAGPEHARWLADRKTARGDGDERRSVVEVHREADALVVTLARPARHNAYSARMRDGLAAALGLAAMEPGLAVILRGAGPSFCSGGDLDEFGTRPDPATAHLVRTTRSPARLLAELRDRVEVEVHGACIGAGIELAAWASRVRATPDAFFQLPEIGMGLIPGAGGTASLPRRIGRQRTAELALTGRRIDAATARAWGLVDVVAPRAATR